MAFTFSTPEGQTVGRELLALFLNTGTKTEPVWSPVGKRVEDSSIEFDWATETKTDVFGDTYTTGKKATRTQTFDPWELDSSEDAQKKIFEDAIVNNNVQALLNQDLLCVHLYYTDNTGAAFAERYPASSVLPTGLGGEGGGNIGMPIEVTFGGARETGTATVTGSTVAFTPAVTV